MWAGCQGNTATEPPVSSEHGRAHSHLIQKVLKRHTQGFQFSTHFHGIAVFWSPFIFPIKIYYPVCFAFQMSVGKTTKVIAIIL